MDTVSDDDEFDLLTPSN